MVIKEPDQPRYWRKEARFWIGIIFIAAGYFAFWSGGVFGMDVLDRAFIRSALDLVGMAAAIAMLAHGFGSLV